MKVAFEALDETQLTRNEIKWVKNKILGNLCVHICIPGLCVRVCVVREIVEEYY
jgi:hypothetical protein